MCTEVYDPDAKFWASSPRELAERIGVENIVWRDGYIEGGGFPSFDEGYWADACLCPVDVSASVEKIGGQFHGYGDSGYVEITLPKSSEPHQ